MVLLALPGLQQRQVPAQQTHGRRMEQPGQELGGKVSERAFLGRCICVMY